MNANAPFAATILSLALFFGWENELRFLIPYRFLLIHQYGTAILICAAVLFVNLTGAFFALGRGFFLKDTGRKLAYFDRELNAGRTPMPPHLHRREVS